VIQISRAEALRPLPSAVRCARTHEWTDPATEISMRWPQRSAEGSAVSRRALKRAPDVGMVDRSPNKTRLQATLSSRQRRPYRRPLPNRNRQGRLARATSAFDGRACLRSRHRSRCPSSAGCEATPLLSPASSVWVVETECCHRRAALSAQSGGRLAAAITLTP
jgi:hypothetical protein